MVKGFILRSFYSESAQILWQLSAQRSTAGLARDPAIYLRHHQPALKSLIRIPFLFLFRFAATLWLVDSSIVYIAFQLIYWIFWGPPGPLQHLFYFNVLIRAHQQLTQPFLRLSSAALTCKRLPGPCRDAVSDIAPFYTFYDLPPLGP